LVVGWCPYSRWANWSGSRPVKGTREFRETTSEKAPLRRNVTQEDVGNVSVFLASELSRCVTGAVLFADNGFNILGGLGIE
jgi:enoyl-[acyl-carrier protein] reductase I